MTEGITTEFKKIIKKDGQGQAIKVIRREVKNRADFGADPDYGGAFYLTLIVTVEVKAGS